MKKINSRFQNNKWRKTIIKINSKAPKTLKI